MPAGYITGNVPAQVGRPRVQEAKPDGSPVKGCCRASLKSGTEGAASARSSPILVRMTVPAWQRGVRLHQRLVVATRKNSRRQPTLHKRRGIKRICTRAPRKRVGSFWPLDKDPSWKSRDRRRDDRSRRVRFCLARSPHEPRRSAGSRPTGRHDNDTVPSGSSTQPQAGSRQEMSPERHDRSRSGRSWHP
jgi:hypothetical protein